MKTSIPPVLIIFALVCLALVQNTQAVSPPPDGGYPGQNTAEGQNALLSLTTGVFNTANGWLSLRAGTTGSFNTGVGAGTLALNTADNNTATGAGALLSNTTGVKNTAVGATALLNNTTGAFNTANGYQALFANGTGIGNTAIGDQALFNNATGNFNTALGTQAGTGVTTANNVICIGTGGENVSDSCYIAQINGSTIPNGTPVFVNGVNKLGTITSSRQFKKDIKPMDKTSEALLALKPVTFHYKREIDPAGASQFGLVAEDVEKVNPDLVVRDKEGKPYSVRYEMVNAMLLNEFLKEHQKVEDLKKDFQATVAQLTARLDEQASQIQKVSAQLEASKPAPQTVLNSR